MEKRDEVLEQSVITLGDVIKEFVEKYDRQPNDNDLYVIRTKIDWRPALSPEYSDCGISDILGLYDSFFS